MFTTIFQPQNKFLKKIVQYFLFLQDDKTSQYTTFPNTNLCISIYRKNALLDLNKSNKKNSFATIESRETYLSYIAGFHNTALQVSIDGPLDEICIVFHPAALRFFTQIPYKELQGSNRVFDMIFTEKDPYFLEQLFDEENISRRVSILEQFLIHHLTSNTHTRSIDYVLGLIKSIHNLDVKSIARQMNINESTLYRLFIDQLGQNPKAFLRTVRFRRAMVAMINSNNQKLTEIAYRAGYADQSHCINDIKKLTGGTPKWLQKNITIEENELVWIHLNE